MGKRRGFMMMALYSHISFGMMRPLSVISSPVVGFPSGQREQTVNLPSQTSKVRILLPPPFQFASLLLALFS
jgi:hypothetical protein